MDATNSSTNDYCITQPFELRIDDCHAGVDLAYDRESGGEVRAIGPGKVVDKRSGPWGNGWGNAILVEHDLPTETIYSLYAHMLEGSVEVGFRCGGVHNGAFCNSNADCFGSICEGEELVTGQTIGKVGSTGNSDHPHLHFAIKRTPGFGFGYMNVCDVGEARRCGYTSEKCTIDADCQRCSNDQKKICKVDSDCGGGTCNINLGSCNTVDSLSNYCDPLSFINEGMCGDISPSPPANTFWPMFQFDPQHSGHSTDNTTFSLSNVPAWTYQVGGMITASPSIVGDVAYFGSSDGKVHAFNATTGIGRVIYSADPSLWNAFFSYWSAAAISGSKIYITADLTSGTFLYALNASDGSEIWPPLRLGSGGAGVSTPVIFDGVIYVGSTNFGSVGCPGGNSVYAISAANGQVLKEFHIDDPYCGKSVRSSPAVTQDTVVVGTMGSCDNCPTVFAFNRITGALKWSAVVSTPYIYPSPSIANGIVYIRSGGAGWDGSLIAFDEQTGNKLWETGIGSASGPGSPAIADGIVYTADEFNIHALDAITGAPIWVPPVPAASAGSCTYSSFIRYPFFAIANGIVFIKSGNECDVAKVYAISGTTGELLWDTGDLGDNGAVGGGDLSTPAVANGRVYFGIGNKFYVYGD